MVININPNPVVPALKKAIDKTKVDVRYSLIQPFANAHIYWDSESRDLVYDIEEPILKDNEKEAVRKLEDAMIELINVNVVTEKTPEKIMEYIDKTAKFLIAELNLKIEKGSYEKIFYYLYRDFVGFNEVEPLLRDYFIEDIECNGVNTPVYIVHRIYHNIRTTLKFSDIEHLASFVEKLAQRSGKYVSYSEPLLDGTLPDGSRVNAVYTQDVASRGPNFTIRKFTKVPWTPTQLVSFNTLSPEMFAYFWILVQYKANIFISGGTSSGKTTLLNAIAFFIPPEAHVISIEDSVTGDSKIITRKEGSVKNITIKEFVDNKIDAEVMTLDKEGKITWVKPSKHIKHTINKEIYEVFTSTGRRIKVTADHSLFSLGPDNSLIEIKPIDLKENESFIAVPRILPINGSEIKEINISDYFNYFEDDFLYGPPMKKFFEKYSYKHLGVNKERYRWWKERNRIKISEFIKMNYKFDCEELRHLRIKSRNNSSIPVMFEISKEFLEFCGLWVGDGSYDNRNKNSVIISNEDYECRDVFRKVADYMGANYSRMNDGGVSLRIHSSVFYKFMKNVLRFDGHSNTKKIPDIIFGLSNEQVKHFIRGYFSADGCIKKYEASCSSQSLELLDGLQGLFLRFGIISRIGQFNRKDKCASLNISNNENLSKFKEIGFLQERKKTILDSIDYKSHHTCLDIIPLSLNKIIELKKISRVKIGSDYLAEKQHLGRNYVQKIAPSGSEFNDLSHNDILWDKVKSVKKISSSETEVFDLSIPGYEKFLCNNIFVHNTRELMLPRENWIPAVARIAVGSGKVGEVDLFDLLKNSFRQNPNYVIVGEVRGKEAFVLFQGMASIPGNERVLVLEDGKRKLVPIEEIDPKKCKAICINPSTEKAEIKSIGSLIKHPLRDKLLKIRTNTGREIMVTEDHSLFTYSNGIIPIEAKNLKENDIIIIPSKLPSEYATISHINLIDYLPDIRVFAPSYVRRAVEILGYEKSSNLVGVKSISDYYSNFKRSLPSSLSAKKFKVLMDEARINNYIDDVKIKFSRKSKSFMVKLELTNEFLRLLGYFISEGSLDNSGRNSRISIYAKDEEIIEDMVRCIKSVGCNLRRRITYGLGSATELSFSHKVLFELLLRYCGKGSGNRQIPDFIFGLSKKRIGEFLTALYNGDGGISKNVISYYTASRKLASDLAYLLLEFGIVSHIIKRGKSKIGKLDNYEIKIYRVEDKIEFLKYAKIADEKLLQEILDIKGQINLDKNGDIYLDKIKSIETIKFNKPIPVYDISVPGRQNFVGGFGGIMLHNSGHPSISTMHADSVDTLIKRLETPPIELSPTLVNSLDCVAIMTHAVIKNNETRRLREIVEIINVNNDGVVLVNTPFKWDASQDAFFFKKESKVFEKISVRYGLSIEELQTEFVNRTKLLYEMYRRRVFDFEEVRKIIMDYYRSPKEVLQAFGIQ